MKFASDNLADNEALAWREWRAAYDRMKRDGKEADPVEARAWEHWLVMSKKLRAERGG